MAAPTRIVCGYIRTPEGEAALERALQEARLRSAHLTVVHFSAAPTEEEDDGPGPPQHDLIRPAGMSEAPAAERGFYEEELEWISRVLTSRGIDHEVKHLPGGRSAAEDLLGVAREQAANLIVIGIRHRSRVGKLLLGSDAQTILLDARCPVLAVKAGESP